MRVHKIIATMLCVMLCLTVSSVAAAGLPANFRVESGNTYLETLLVKDLNETVKQTFKDAMACENLMITITTMGYYEFFILDPRERLGAYGLDAGVSFEIKNQAYEIKSIIFKPIGDKLEYFTTRLYTPSQLITGANLVFYSPDTISYVSFEAYQLRLNIQGELLIVTDEEDYNPNPDGGGGLLDFLKSFWDKLLQFFKDLIIPPPDYFKNWFEEVKTKFSEKMGSLATFFDSIGGIFDGLKSKSYEKSKVMFTVPDNSIFMGYKGTSVDLLGFASSWLSWLRTIFNGILVLFTGLICYRKLIALIRG